MRLLRQQESTPFFTAEEGRKRRFFQNFPCRLHRIVLQFSCLRIWEREGENAPPSPVLSWTVNGEFFRTYWEVLSPDTSSVAGDAASPDAGASGARSLEAVPAKRVSS